MTCCKMVKQTKNVIFCKYLKDTINFFISPKQKFDPEVLEIFSTIEYLGGGKFFIRKNFIRAPMFY